MVNESVRIVGSMNSASRRTLHADAEANVERVAGAVQDRPRCCNAGKLGAELQAGT